MPLPFLYYNVTGFSRVMCKKGILAKSSPRTKFNVLNKNTISVMEVNLRTKSLLFHECCRN